MNILICDDHSLLRDGLKLLLSQHTPPFEIDEAASFDDVRSKTNGADYDLVLLDLTMPGSTGPGDVGEVCRLFECPVAVISAKEDPAVVQAAADQGAAGFIPKSHAAEDILAAVVELLDGQPSFPDTATEAPAAVEADALLTSRQKTVLQGLVDGLSNREIATALSLSEGTVKQYVSQVLLALGVSNRTQAAIKGRSILGAAAHG